MSTKHLVSLLLAIGFGGCTLRGAPRPPESAPRSTSSEQPAPSQASPDAAAPSSDSTGHVVLDVRVVDLAAEERAAH